MIDREDDWGCVDRMMGLDGVVGSGEWDSVLGRDWIASSTFLSRISAASTEDQAGVRTSRTPLV